MNLFQGILYLKNPVSCQLDVIHKSNQDISAAKFKNLLDKWVTSKRDNSGSYYWVFSALLSRVNDTGS